MSKALFAKEWAIQAALDECASLKATPARSRKKGGCLLLAVLQQYPTRRRNLGFVLGLPHNIWAADCAVIIAVHLMRLFLLGEYDLQTTLRNVDHLLCKALARVQAEISQQVKCK
ncbi:hypothetical protein [Chitinophaga barathri]|uniref:Uncharacterized protein n=1 Tax=Chitinophaga barathri TaxID=1647451 RepID=A0A3N4M797_9BACT|nr:hypothetical protein [Chitinophaga barathri]RPD39108.1 hypothetical protein EG028_21070 [Chitinophaga barathri]